MYLWPSRDGLGPFSHPNLTSFEKWLRFKTMEQHAFRKSICSRSLSSVSRSRSPVFADAFSGAAAAAAGRVSFELGQPS